MTSVEIDPLLVQSLSNNSQLKDLSIIQDDILNIDIENLSMRKPVRILGNIPYNITSSIIFWLIEQLDFWSDAYYDAKRSGRKTNSGRGTKQYGRISVVTSVFLKKKICLNIPQKSFILNPRFAHRLSNLVSEPNLL